ncbi:hypothetical protein LTR66_006426 [Elasticomyces elasticus]|nr:hypothetical protein LTR50_004045 [Elasticomyces elasticus]KAK4991936.1 hypothetical protein LTR66_006426 [Elasticomyces elasticus]KAK5009676.1 hypothetical protein LTR28_013970 [Elasticomyces elasticus]
MPISGPLHHSDLDSLTNQTGQQIRSPTPPTAPRYQPNSPRASMTSEQLPAYADVVKDRKVPIVAEKEFDGTARRGKKESLLRSILTDVVKDRKSPVGADGEIDGTARRGKKESTLRSILTGSVHRYNPHFALERAVMAQSLPPHSSPPPKQSRGPEPSA